MHKFIIKSMCILLIVFTAFLVLNNFYVIDISIPVRDAFIFLTLALILLTSMNEALSGSNKFIKFLNIIIILLTVASGAKSANDGYFNVFIYISLLLSLINAVMVLTYSKA